jgi:hypothetical protein
MGCPLCGEVRTLSIEVTLPNDAEASWCQCLRCDGVWWAAAGQVVALGELVPNMATLPKRRRATSIR